MKETLQEGGLLYYEYILTQGFNFIIFEQDIIQIDQAQINVFF